MKVLIAPDKFKGSLSTKEVCAAIADGLLISRPDAKVTKHPLADGGDGSLDVLSNHLELKKVSCPTTDPLDREMVAQYLISSSGEAFIEVAAASGMVLLQPDERNPLITSSRGTGVLIRDAVTKGATHINLLLGGSATNDAGTGILQALGYRFITEHGRKIVPNGENLLRIREIIVPESREMTSCAYSLWCDVTNPFFGTNGAAHIFARQKGANSAMIQQLDEGLRNISDVINQTTGIDLTNVSGAGAAGGIAGGLVGLLNAEVVSGTEQIIKLTGFEEVLSRHDMVITGEGSLDEQSLNGKVVDGVASLARKHRKQLVLVCGINQLSKTQISNLGADECLEIMALAASQQEAMEQAEGYLRQLAVDILV